jgi:hypothetical protein
MYFFPRIKKKQTEKQQQTQSTQEKEAKKQKHNPEEANGSLCKQKDLVALWVRTHGIVGHAVQNAWLMEAMAAFPLTQ